MLAATALLLTMPQLLIMPRPLAMSPLLTTAISN